jgi:flagellar biosynthesis/type III secretory pathway protein FliH
MSNPEETRALDPAEFPELPKSRQRMEVTLLLARAEKAEAELERFAERVAGEVEALADERMNFAQGKGYKAGLRHAAELIRNSAKGEG